MDKDFIMCVQLNFNKYGKISSLLYRKCVDCLWRKHFVSDKIEINRDTSEWNSRPDPWDKLDTQMGDLHLARYYVPWILFDLFVLSLHVLYTLGEYPNFH